MFAASLSGARQGGRENAGRAVRQPTPAWLPGREIAAWGGERGARCPSETRTLAAQSVSAESAGGSFRGRNNGPVGSARPYALVATRPRNRVVARLRRRGQPAGLDGVPADLDRAAEPCPVPGQAAGAGLTWDEADRDDPSWWPQGVACLRSGEVLLVSWYA